MFHEIKCAVVKIGKFNVYPSAFLLLKMVHEFVQTKNG